MLGRYPPLELPEGRLGPMTNDRRRAAVQEAIGWPQGTSLDDQVRTSIYTYREPETGFVWEVALAKPGKEAFRSGDRRNPNDMYPVLIRDDLVIEYTESFGGIWAEMEAVSERPRGPLALEILGRLFVCGAYMAYHHEVSPGVWRIRDDAEMLKVWSDLENCVAHTSHVQGNIPMRVFVHLVDAIGLQEDTKYVTRNGRIAGTTGRPNNLATCASFSACLLRRASWSELCGRMARRGVAPLSQQAARQLFPPMQ
jgi:hypothetical protein